MMFALVVVAALRLLDPGADRDRRRHLHARRLPHRALARRQHQRAWISSRVARARGEGAGYLMLRGDPAEHGRARCSTDFGLRFVFIVLLLSGLSFLGLGMQPPDADWGALVRENIGGLAEGAPAVIAPAIAIASLTIGVNLLIDNLPGRRPRAAEHAEMRPHRRGRRACMVARATAPDAIAHRQRCRASRIAAARCWR